MFTEAPLAPFGCSRLPAVQGKHHLTPPKRGGGRDEPCVRPDPCHLRWYLSCLHPSAMTIEPKSGAVWGKCHSCKVKRSWLYFFEALSYISRDAALRSQWQSRGEIMKIYVDVEGLEVQGKRNILRMKQTMFRRWCRRSSPKEPVKHPAGRGEEVVAARGEAAAADLHTWADRGCVPPAAAGNLRRPLRGHIRVILAELCHWNTSRFDKRKFDRK